MLLAAFSLSNKVVLTIKSHNIWNITGQWLVPVPLRNYSLTHSLQVAYGALRVLEQVKILAFAPTRHVMNCMQIQIRQTTQTLYTPICGVSWPCIALDFMTYLAFELVHIRPHGAGATSRATILVRDKSPDGVRNTVEDGRRRHGLGSNGDRGFSAVWRGASRTRCDRLHTVQFLTTHLA